MNNAWVVLSPLAIMLPACIQKKRELVCKRQNRAWLCWLHSTYVLHHYQYILSKNDDDYFTITLSIIIEIIEKYLNKIRISKKQQQQQQQQGRYLRVLSWKRDYRHLHHLTNWLEHASNRRRWRKGPRMCLYVHIYTYMRVRKKKKKNDDISKIDIILYLFIYLYINLLVASQRWYTWKHKKKENLK